MMVIRNFIVAVIYLPGVIMESIRLHREYPGMNKTAHHRMLCEYIQRTVPFK